MNVFVNTEKQCFLCGNIVENTGQITEDYDTMQAICRYLNINTCELVLQSVMGQVDPGELKNECHLWGKFCQSCKQHTTHLTTRILEMEIVQMLLMENARNFLTILESTNVGFAGNLSLATLLREKIKLKCAEKLKHLESTETPIVLLSRLPDMNVAESVEIFHGLADSTSTNLIMQQTEVQEATCRSSELSSKTLDLTCGFELRKSSRIRKPNSRYLNSIFNKKGGFQETKASPKTSMPLVRTSDLFKSQSGAPAFSNDNEGLKNHSRPNRSALHSSPSDCKSVSGTVILSEKSSKNPGLPRYKAVAKLTEKKMKQKLKRILKNCKYNEGDKKYRCVFCDLRYSYSRIRIHIVEHHTDLFMAKFKQRRVSIKDFNNYCRTSIEYFISSDTKANSLVWTCMVCDKIFKYRSGIKYHVPIHHSEQVSKHLQKTQRKRDKPALSAEVEEIANTPVEFAIPFLDTEESMSLDLSLDSDLLSEIDSIETCSLVDLTDEDIDMSDGDHSCSEVFEQNVDKRLMSPEIPKNSEYIFYYK